MKNFYLLLLVLSTFLCFQSCQQNEPQPAWVEYCEDVSGGELDIDINGQNWKSGCVQSTYSETITEDYSSKILLVYAYNFGATFYLNSEIEVFYIIHSEITVDGETEVSTAAVFIDGFILTEQDTDNWEGKSFVTDDSENDQFTITQLTSDFASGSFNLKLFNEDGSEEEINANGTFSAVIEQ